MRSVLYREINRALLLELAAGAIAGGAFWALAGSLLGWF